MNNTNDFECKYFAPTPQERKEIESIRNRYLPEASSSDQLLKLRKLDSKVKNTPATISICVGIIGTLIFGLGFTMILEWYLPVWGVLVSMFGAVPIALAYPINQFLKKRMKAKYSKEILEISDELLNKNEE